MKTPPSTLDRTYRAAIAADVLCRRIYGVPLKTSGGKLPGLLADAFAIVKALDAATTTGPEVCARDAAAWIDSLLGDSVALDWLERHTVTVRAGGRELFTVAPDMDGHELIASGLRGMIEDNAYVDRAAGRIVRER